MVKPSQGKLPLSILIAVVSTLTFGALLYTESISSLTSGSIFKLKSCPNKKHAVSKSKSTKGTADYYGISANNLSNFEVDDRFEFNPNECSVVPGKWVFNSLLNPLYSDRACPYLDLQFSCKKNGRPDSEYLHWEWQPDDCMLPRFNPRTALQKLRGKRLMFVGDSLQRGQWESFVCMVESIIPEKHKSMQRGRIHSVFKAKEYNATMEFYWAPFLVESNSDIHIIRDPKKRIISVDSIAKHARNWIGIDILVFNTYIWWLNGLKIKSLWGSFANGEEGYEEFEPQVAYRIALKTWANWVDSNVNPNTTRIFFTTMSPTHMRSQDWNHKDGIKCYNETKPVMKKRYWGTGSDKRLMRVVDNILEKMKIPVTVINITQMSEYRIDGHSSVYTEYEGKLLSDEEKADPIHHADCIHWCLPGVPDTWNQVFLAHL